MKRILVGVDFSERSDRAEAQAFNLAERAGAEIVVAHVIDEDLPPRVAAAAEAEARDRAGALLERGRKAIVPCRVTTARGEPHIELPRVARETGADLVVLGAHRKSPERNAFIGTTADRILRAHDIPVLVVRNAIARDYKSAMAAIDFAAGDMEPLAALTSLELAAPDRVYAVFGVETEKMRKLKKEAASFARLEEAFANEMAKLSQEAGKLAASAALDPSRVVVKPLLLNAPDLIFEAAREAKADLIVVGSRRKGADHNRIIGSVSESVLRRAEIDVLVVRAN